MPEKSKIIAVASFFVVIVIASIFSLYKLTVSPPTWYDEGIYNQIAVNTGLHGSNSIQVAPSTFVSGGFVTGGYPFIIPIALSIKSFGIGLFQARIVMVIFILLLISLVFCLMSKMYNYKIAFLSTLLLVTFPVIYGNGKNVLGEIPGLMYLFLFLICVYIIETKKFEGVLTYVLAGITGGLCLATKPIFFLLGGAVLLAVFFKRNEIDFKWKNLAWGFIAFLIPIIIWFKLQFLSSDSAASVLSYYVNPYGLKDIGSVILSNFLRFFREVSPLYFLLIEIFWVCSFAHRYFSKRNITLTESIAFFFTILVSVAYLRTAGWYRYFFVAEVLAIVFLPVNIKYVLDFLSEKFNFGRLHINKILFGVIMIFVMFQSYQLLFNSWVSDHYKSSISKDMVEFFSKLSPKTSFFIYNVPEIAIFLPNQDYYQYFEPTDSLNFGYEQISVLQGGVPDILITTSKQWYKLSPKFTKYEIYKNIDAYVILKKKI